MTTQKTPITTYERDKDKVKISGDRDAVKNPILIDQISRIIRWLVIGGIIIMTIYLFKDKAIGELLKLLKVLLPFMTFFVAVAGWMLMLSG